MRLQRSFFGHLHFSRHSVAPRCGGPAGNPYAIKVPMKLFSLISAGAVLCLAAGSWQLCGQTTDLSATVQFSNGQTLTLTDFSNSIGVQPGDTVTVIVSFPLDDVGQTARIEPLDGGRVFNSSGIVAADGTLNFTFQAPANPGQDRIALRHGSRTLRMQFWVLDSANPQNNPPVAMPANPGS